MHSWGESTVDCSGVVYVWVVEWTFRIVSLDVTNSRCTELRGKNVVRDFVGTEYKWEKKITQNVVWQSKLLKILFTLWEPDFTAKVCRPDPAGGAGVSILHPQFPFNAAVICTNVRVSFHAFAHNTNLCAHRCTKKDTQTWATLSAVPTPPRGQCACTPRICTFPYIFVVKFLRLTSLSPNSLQLSKKSCWCLHINLETHCRCRSAFFRSGGRTYVQHIFWPEKLKRPPSSDTKPSGWCPAVFSTKGNAKFADFRSWHTYLLRPTDGPCTFKTFFLCVKFCQFCVEFQFFIAVVLAETLGHTVSMVCVVCFLVVWGHRRLNEKLFINVIYMWLSLLTSWHFSCETSHHYLRTRNTHFDVVNLLCELLCFLWNSTGWSLTYFRSRGPGPQTY